MIGRIQDFGCDRDTILACVRIYAIWVRISGERMMSESDIIIFYLFAHREVSFESSYSPRIPDRARINSAAAQGA
jgi:hypothetical protein